MEMEKRRLRCRREDGDGEDPIVPVRRDLAPKTSNQLIEWNFRLLIK